MTVVACQQLAPRIKNLVHNVELSTNAVREASMAGADIIVLPELITCGYMFESREKFEKLQLIKIMKYLNFGKRLQGRENM
jgi:predicted amidohydrolase